MAAAYNPQNNGGPREKIKFEYGRPETLALKFVSGKNVDGRFGPQVMFTTTDERVFYLDYEDASDVESTLAGLQVQPGQPVQITKIRHPRGGGHGFQVHRVAAAHYSHPVDRRADPQDLVSDLEQSLRIAQNGTRPRAPIAIADEYRRTLPASGAPQFAPQIATAMDLSPEAELMYQSFVPAIDA
ncbi:MAG TPA: hypothetical protein VG273_16600, partial [Bryobacteraceae bacterium]|nr:hypothetical protein [Bryobacteraceae bacterium]